MTCQEIFLYLHKEWEIWSKDSGGLYRLGSMRREQREDVCCNIFCSLTCVGQIDDGEENDSCGQWHTKKEKCLKLLPSQPVLKILQEGIRLQEGKDTCRDTYTLIMVPGATSYWHRIKQLMIQFCQNRTILTCCSHVLTCPYWLEAHKRDLHGEHQTHDIKCAVSYMEKKKCI